MLSIGCRETWMNQRYILDFLRLLFTRDPFKIHTFSASKEAKPRTGASLQAIKPPIWGSRPVKKGG